MGLTGVVYNVIPIPANSKLFAQDRRKAEELIYDRIKQRIFVTGSEAQ
jgi:hypothetical protein